MLNYVNVFLIIRILYISKIAIFQNGVVEKYNTKFKMKLFDTLFMLVTI